MSNTFNTVAEIQLAQWTDYCIVAASGAISGVTSSDYACSHYLALLVYEYLITMGLEYRFIWKTPRTGNSAIFLLNRLNMLCMWISLMMFAENWHKIEVRISNHLRQ